MTYTIVGQSIYDILSPLVGPTTLKAVYNYDKKTSQLFPFATISTRDGNEDFLDTCNNITTYKYTIRVVDQNKDVETMEARMRTLCDEILAEIRKKANQTLDGVAVKFGPFSVVWGWFDGQEPQRVFEITCDSTLTYNIN